MILREYITTLNNISLFKNFSEEDIINLMNDFNYTIKEYEKDDVVFMEDELCKNLSILLEGNIEIQKIDPNGKILTVANLKTGDVFGENLLFGDKNLYPMTVISKSSSRVLNLPKESVASLCQKNEIFLYAFLKILSNKAVALSSKLKEVTLKTIRQKICEFLIMQYNSSKSNYITLPMSKKEWADKLGIQRPSLSRELIKMKEENIIDYDKDVIQIKNIELLKANI